MNDLWRGQAYIGLCAISFYVGFLIAKRHHWATGALIAYSLVSALTVFQSPLAVYSGMLQIRVDQSSGQAFAQLLGISLVGLLVPVSAIGFIAKTLCGFGVLNCMVVIARGYGLWNASTFDAGVIAMMLPLLSVYVYFLLGWKWAALVTLLVIAAIGRGGGSTAYFVLAGAVAIFFAIELKLKKAIPAALTTSAAVLLIGRHNNPGNAFFDSNGRAPTWDLIMSDWWSTANVWLGTGTGTFEWRALASQNRTTNVFFCMHNDYLQILYEQGIVGFSLFAITAAVVFSRLRAVPALAASMVGFAVLMLSQSPLRFFITQCCAAFLVVLTSRDPEDL